MNEFLYKLFDLMNEYNVRPGRHTEFMDTNTQMIAAMISYDDFDIDKPFYNLMYVEDDAVQRRRVYL